MITKYHDCKIKYKPGTGGWNCPGGGAVGGAPGGTPICCRGPWAFGIWACWGCDWRFGSSFASGFSLPICVPKIIAKQPNKFALN